MLANHLGFDDRKLLLFGIPLITLIIPPIFFQRDSFEWVFIAHSFVFTVVIWLGNRMIFVWMDKRYPNQEDWKKRLWRLIFWCVVFTVSICSVLGPTLDVLLPHPDDDSKMTYWNKFGASFIMLLTVGAIYESMRFFYLWKKTLGEKEQVERAHLASQLEGLRNQVNPHFLFNSLNTLIYLIPEDTNKAIRFVQQLSKVYRYVLESRDAKIIPLQEELDFLKSYVFLQKERFGENLSVELRGLETGSQTAIVPLTLQMLFENAIKHNIISTEKPLRIEVFSENGHLIVRNNLQRKNQVMDSTGVGLDNIRTRYRLLTDQPVEVIVSPQYFTVVLPFLPAPVFHTRQTAA